MQVEEISHYPPADFEPALTHLAQWLWPESWEEHKSLLVLGNGASELIDLVIRDSIRDNNPGYALLDQPHSAGPESSSRATDPVLASPVGLSLCLCVGRSWKPGPTVTQYMEYSRSAKAGEGWATRTARVFATAE